MYRSVSSMNSLEPQALPLDPGSLLTFEAQNGGHELGMVMGAQEGYGALARILGPLLAAYLWSVTVEGTGIWTFHTCFRVAGVIFLLAVSLQLTLRLNEEPT